MKRILALFAVILAIQASGAAQEETIKKARAAAASGDHARALELLEPIYGDIRNHAEALGLLARSALMAGSFDSGSSYALRLVELDPENVEGHRIAAQCFYWRAEEAKVEPTSNAGRVNSFYEESVISCNELLKRQPKDLEAWNLKGHALYWLERHRESAEAFAKAAELDPKNVDVLSNLARAYAFEKETEKMKAAMDRAMKADPDNGALNLLKAQHLSIVGTDEAMKAAADICIEGLVKKRVDWNTGNGCAGFILNAYGKDGSWDRAVSAMDGWVKAHPGDSGAWWWRGDALFRAGQVEKAAESFERSWNVSRESLASAARSAGHCYWRLAAPLDGSGNHQYRNANKGHAAKAFQWFAKALGVKGWDWSYAGSDPAVDIIGLFGGLQENGHLDFAAEQIEKVCLPAAPDHWRLLNILGLYYRDAGGAASGSKGKELCRKSAAYYEKAAAGVLEDPGTTPTEKAWILNDTGLMFHFPQYQINDMEKGMSYYRKALSHDPDYTDANENLGIALNALGKHEEAIAYLERVLQKEPGRPVSRRQLERARQALGRD